MSRTAFGRGWYTQAGPERTRAGRLDSLDARARFHLGNALLRTGKREEGRRQLQLYRRLEEEERGISAMKNMLLTAPDRAEIYHDMGIVLARRGQYEQARAR